MAMSVTQVVFSYNSPSAFSVRFLVVRPEGTNYRVVDRSAQLPFTPPASGMNVYSANLAAPLAFQLGDVLGVTSYGSGSIGLGIAERAGALSTFAGELATGSVTGRDSRTLLFGENSIAAEVSASINCSDAPAPSILLPVVGDVVGAAHFVTDVDYLMAFACCGGVWPSTFTLKDRLGNPGAVREVTVTVPSAMHVAFHADSLATTLGISPPFFGPLIIAIPDLNGTAGRGDKEMTASARITAATASCSNGETGSSLPAVGCGGIGRRLRIPFKVPPNHRLNLGIVSAQLTGCGVRNPAVSVTVNYAGSDTVISMPGESTQIGDITGAASPIVSARGATQGYFTIRVADEASRIAAYLSLLDNVSQDSTVTLAIPVE
jgi:hypothetical protein